LKSKFDYLYSHENVSSPKKDITPHQSPPSPPLIHQKFSTMRKCIRRRVRLFVLFLFSFPIHAQNLDYTANETIAPYNGVFRYGVNTGAYPGWVDTQLADISRGKPSENIEGIGINSFRITLPEHFLEYWGYHIREDVFEYYQSIGIEDNTVFIGFPTEEHRDKTLYCPDTPTDLFANLYEPIWDDGEHGTPINEDNYYALYLYKMVPRYKNQVKFWEIWNEPDVNWGYNAIKPPNEEGSWWTTDPPPCEFILHAPVYHYIRMLRISYEVIKSIDPTAYIAVGGIGTYSFLDVLLRNTDNPDEGDVHPDFPNKGGAYFDVLSYHTYPHHDGSLDYWDNSIMDFRYTRHSDAAAKSVIDRKKRFEETLFQYGYDGSTHPEKLWIITESNIPRESFNGSIGSMEAQRNFLIKTPILCQQNNILQYHIYALSEGGPWMATDAGFNKMGLYEPLSDLPIHQAKMYPSAIGYKTTSEILFDTQYDAAQTAEMQLPENVKGGAFKNTEGEYIYALWAVTETDQSEEANAIYAFPEAWKLPNLKQMEWDFGLTETHSVVSSKGVPLTGTPVFLKVTDEAILTSIEVLPTAIFEAKLFPNIFRNHTFLQIELKEKSSVHIEVFDLQGRIVQELLPIQSMNRGIYQLEFEGREWESGVYFCGIEVGGERKFLKMVKL